MKECLAAFLATYIAATVIVFITLALSALATSIWWWLWNLIVPALHGPRMNAYQAWVVTSVISVTVAKIVEKRAKRRSDAQRERADG